MILFGSYARDEADEEWDLDFVVIEPRMENVVDRDLAVLAHIKDQPDVHSRWSAFMPRKPVEKSLKAVLFERQMGFWQNPCLERLAGLLAAEGVGLPCAFYFYCVVGGYWSQSGSIC